jgi:hypothetical protein
MTDPYCGIVALCDLLAGSGEKANKQETSEIRPVDLAHVMSPVVSRASFQVLHEHHPAGAHEP